MKLKTLSPTFVALLVTVVTMTLALSGGAALSASSGRSRPLKVTKECSEYKPVAGSFCTVTSSSLGRLKDARIYYTQPPGIPEGLLDSNIVLDAGNGNRAVGRCTLDFATGLGLCTFSDGTGRLAGFNARVNVSALDPAGINWLWDGTYSFNPVD